MGAIGLFIKIAEKKYPPLFGIKTRGAITLRLNIL